MSVEREWGVETLSEVEIQCEAEKEWVLPAVSGQSRWVAGAALIPRPEWAVA
jgi:hypothetical protein